MKPIQGFNRVEVISPSGRVLVCDSRAALGPVVAEAHLQDGGRTLKVFLNREPDYLPSVSPDRPTKEQVEAAVTALRRLRNEASGFVAISDGEAVGWTNLRIMHQGIAEADAVLALFARTEDRA